VSIWVNYFATMKTTVDFQCNKLSICPHTNPGARRWSEN